MYKLYFLINEARNKTYIGFTDNVDERITTHRYGKVKTTKDFGNFVFTTLEEVKSVEDARRREKYWKSSAGRKKLKIIFDKLNK